MLATIGGFLALVLGLAILLLPLLATELSRARDSVWGAVVLLLGLVLVTQSDRLAGAPMLGVLCAGLLIGRLGSEVAQGRWRTLTPEEQRRLGSVERWTSSLAQLGASLAGLVRLVAGLARGLGGWIAERRQPRSKGKRWVRPEEEAAPAVEEGRGGAGSADVREVADFHEIDDLLRSAAAPTDPADATAAAEPLSEPALSAAAQEPEPVASVADTPGTSGEAEDLVEATVDATVDATSEARAEATSEAGATAEPTAEPERNGEAG